MGFFIVRTALRESEGRVVSRLLPFFAKNRRDGARLLSSALVILAVALTQLTQPWGQVVSVIASVLCLYWWFAYRRLER